MNIGPGFVLPAYKPEPCAFCGATSENMVQEMHHMNMMHPEVVVERLAKAGFFQQPDGTWELQ